MCGARVGNKGKICTKLRSACNVGSHEPKVVQPGLYIMSGENKVWEEGVSLDGLTQSVVTAVNDMLLRNLPRNEWLVIRDALKAIHAAQGAAERTAMLLNFDNIISNLMVHHPLPSEVTEDNEGEVQALRARAGTSPMKGRRFKPSNEEDVDMLSGLTPEERMVVMGVEMGDHKEENDGLFSDAFMEIKKVAAVQGAIGDEGLPLVKQVQDLEKEVIALGAKAGATETFKDSHRQRVDVLRNDVNMLTDDVSHLETEGIPSLSRALGIQIDTVSDLSSKVEDISNKVDRMEGGAGRTGTTVAVATSGVTPRTFRDLENRVVALEVNPVTIQPSQPAAADVEARLDNLEKVADATAGSETVKVDGERWTFSGLGGTGEFVESSGIPVGDNDFGFSIGLLCQDPGQLMMMAAEQGTMTKEQFQDYEVHAEKVKRSPYCSTHATSAQSVLPACFTTKGGTQLSKLKTAEDWDAGDGATGVGVVLLKAMRDLRQQEQERVRSDLRSFPRLQELAMHYLTSTMDFLEKFFHWIGNYYRVMVRNTGASSDKEKAECWKLVLTMVSTVFEVLWEARRPAKNAYLADAREGLVMCIYAAARTQALMKTFELNNFSEHPRIFPKLMTFIFESHTSKTEFLALKKAQGVTANKVESFQTKLDLIFNRLKALERGGGDEGEGGKWKNRKAKNQE